RPRNDAALLFEYKIYGQYEEHKTDQVIDPETLIFKHQHRKQGEDYQCNDFLNYLELPEIERSPVSLVTYLIGRYLKTVFEQGNSPTDQDDGPEPELGKSRHGIKLEMAVPGQGHKNIRNDQKGDGQDGFVHIIKIDLAILRKKFVTLSLIHQNAGL